MSSKSSKGYTGPNGVLEAPKEEAPALAGQAHENGPRTIEYVQGLRFWALSILLGLNWFLVTVELSVVSTALVGISDDIGGLQEASWILTSYLLGWVGIVTIFAKLSDIFGRKAVMMICLITFTVFSGACGAAQTATQLIILRSFQGLGGGGTFTMNLIFISEAVPPPQYPRFAAMIGIPAALAMGLGPIIGGAVTSTTTWRWIFLMNLPPGVICIAMTWLVVPNGFPYHGQQQSKNNSQTNNSTIKNLMARVDFFGSLLLLTATISLTAGFQEADSRFQWRSSYVISLLTASGLFWITLMIWERRISRPDGGAIEPILPWRFLTERVLLGIILGSALMGGPWTASFFILPSEFQLLNGLSGLDAGIRYLPFTLGITMGTVICSVLNGKPRVPPLYCGLVGAMMQVVGYALLSISPAPGRIPAQTYVYQVMAGLGIGAVYQTVIILIPLAAGPRDSAVGLGIVMQFRIMGGAVVIAVVTSLFNGHVMPRLRVLGLDSLQDISRLETGSTLFDSQELLVEIRSVLAEGYRRQFISVCAFSALQIPALVLIWKRKQITVPLK